ncbi:MAG: TIM barrel protein [Clostridia bacterium]|jgi:deoxyribonuclease-4|nr:TIM barrel protein [Clostridiales bacterium]
METRFGPSGNSLSFYQQGHKSSVEAPKWLADMGLSAYEYSCTKGVKIKKDTAARIGDEANKYDIALSIHAPYYINLASPDSKKRDNSVNYIIQSLEAARWMGAKRVVFHPGACSNMDRGSALELALDTLKRVINEADDMGLGDIVLCPETLGKLNQLGSLEEVLRMCRVDERLLPTIDFGHIHAYTGGGLKTYEDYKAALDTIEEALGMERLKHMHIHFSRVEFTKGGEKKHWTFADTQYGPEFRPLARAIIEKGLKPIIICESRGTMAEDAKEMKEIYESVINGR